MLENLFTNVFGRSKSKSSGRNSQSDVPGQTPSSDSISGPFSMSTPQMPQPPNLPYPPAPYPSGYNQPSYYPQLPFSQPPRLPEPYTSPNRGALGPSSPGTNYGTLAPSQISPLDSVPFEARLTLNSSTNLVNLDQLFKEIKKAGDVVERADAYLRSNQSDYDFKTEQGLIYQ